MEGTLYIIDALNFLFRAFHALPPLTTSKGLPTGAVYGLAQMILRIEREQKPSHLCVVFDAPGRTFRDDIFSGYKADRPPMPPELSAQVELTHQLIDGLALPVLSVPGVEADDVIASLARTACAAGLAVVICSSDKDLMQLCCPEISLLDTMYNRMVGPAQVQEKFGVAPERVGDVLALMGDSIDNVPGVAGVGPKTAAELINRFGSLDGLLANIGEVKTKKGQAIAAAREAVVLSRQLVALREDIELPRPLAALSRISPDFPRLRTMFRDLEFTRLLPQLDALELALGPGAASPPPLAAPVVVPAPAPAEPPPPALLVLDRPALEQLARAIELAGQCGLAVLADGPDPTRADLVGLAVVLPDGAAARHYVPLAHRLLGAPTTLREAEALALLAPLLASERIAKSVHDGKFLDVLLRVRGHRLAGVASDSMLAAYLLDASRTRYELEVVAGAEGVGAVSPRVLWLGSGRTARPASETLVDQAGAHLAAEAAAALALRPLQDAKLAALGLASLYQDVELPLADVLARVECLGIRIDADHLRQIGLDVARSIAALEAEIHTLAGTTFNIASPKQLAEVLFGKLALPIIRRTKTGPSTDADVLEELAALHPVPARIVEYRVLTKLKGTYIDALPALVNPRTGRLHTTFNQAVAATGRLSSSDPNLQNIPIRTEVGRRIREAFVADPGYRIVSADYSQIELRILAHFSQDPDFLDAFRTGQDIHQRTAAQVFGVPPEAVTAEQRRIAKAINFGLVFGQTDFGLAQALRIPRGQARSYIDSYFARYAGVRLYMERAIAEARQSGEVTTLLGRRRPLPEIRATRQQDRSHAERIARNSPIQGSAADLLKLAMIRVAGGLPAWPDARLLLTVHDELVFEVKVEAVTAFSAWVKEQMESIYQLAVPLVVDVGSGPTWGSAH
jgi:DNA polymerase I